MECSIAWHEAFISLKADVSISIFYDEDYSGSS